MVNVLRKLRMILCPHEDDGYSDHMVGQKNGPYYCGTAFCGHYTKKAARECRKERRDAFDAITKAGGDPYQNKTLYPEQDPANWPINRSSVDMQNEYKERTRKESSSCILY